jgi:hypothetical protein
MKTRHRLAISVCCMLAVSCKIEASRALASGTLAPDATGKITLLAPCDQKAVDDDVKTLMAKLKTVLKLDETGVVFASLADVKADADGTIFLLELKVEQNGSTVSSSESRKVLNSGQSATLGAFCGVSPCKGKCKVSASVKVLGGANLDAKSCTYTCGE